MAGKNKGGRETRKPKQDQNKKPKGQTPPAGTAAPPVTQTPRRPSAR
jgi:hypothetical protein